MLTVDEVIVRVKTEADHSADDGTCWLTCPNVKRLQVYRHKLREALEALDALIAVQNGPPLLKYEREWNEAMARAEALFKEGE